MDIWKACQDSIAPESISHELLRVVESQVQIATNSIVDNVDEQLVLEKMLEDTKPTLPRQAAGLHYLLATPFRYPPLKHGSRFGTRFEPSLFYGSYTLETAFSETAYYRFLFWAGMSNPPPSGKFITQHTIFAIHYETQRGLKLQNMPFCKYDQYLLDKSHYSSTQMLGHHIRGNGIQAFEYKSARDRSHGLNAALLTPEVFTVKQPIYQSQWICDTSPHTVSFYTPEKIYKYTYETYLAKGQFPAPAM